MPHPKGLRPTKKMKKLAKAVAKGLPMGQAGKIAGYSNVQAASRAFKTIKLRFHPALEAAGYDVDSELTELYARLKEKTNCTETIWAQSNGIFMDKKEVIPHGEQRAAINDCLRVLGVIGNGHDDGEPPPVGLRPGHISIQVVLPPGTDARAYLELQSQRAANPEQPVLALGTHKDKRRPGPKPTL